MVLPWSTQLPLVAHVQFVRRKTSARMPGGGMVPGMSIPLAALFGGLGALGQDPAAEQVHTLMEHFTLMLPRAEGAELSFCIAVSPLNL